MKLSKNIIIGAIVTIIIITLSSISLYLFDNAKINEAKNRALESNLLNKEKAINTLSNELSENNSLIFFKKEAIESLENLNGVLDTIKELQVKAESIKAYNECTNNQVKRIINNKEVRLDYCDKTKEDLTKTKQAFNKNLVEDVNLNPGLLMLCEDVGAKDPYRCATYGTLVFNYESWRGTSRRCTEDKNCYWIKNPTDKGGLVWKWEVWTGRHLIFETQEMGSFAFAYYYAKYHEHRDANNFVNRWAGWNNTTYIEYIKQNYYNTYKKYQKVLTIQKK